MARLLQEMSPAAPSPRRQRTPLLVLAAAVAALTGAGMVAWGPGRADPGSSAALGHVHGLGMNPVDGALYAAAHDGLYQLPATGDPIRVAGRVQDVMGFTVAGPDWFLASGHPGPDGDGPAAVGLIESTDAGRTWVTRSLPGEADFHALDISAATVYGYDAASGQLRVSSDGRTWASTPLAGVADLAADPADPNQVLATTAQGVVRSRDRGRTFGAAGGPVLLLVDWASDGTLIGISPQGLVQSSRNAGRTWQPRGNVGGAPEALTADGDRLHVAVAGRVLSSTDGGETFTVRGQA